MGRHSVAQRRLGLFIYAKTRDTMRTMAHPRKSHDHVSTNKAVSSVDNDNRIGDDPIDLSVLGFTKVSYAVEETRELLRSTSRSSVFGQQRPRRQSHLSSSASAALPCTQRSNEETSNASNSAK